jgi:hypothetical protein
VIGTGAIEAAKTGVLQNAAAAVALADMPKNWRRLKRFFIG